MLLAKILNKKIKFGGFILEEANLKKHSIGLVNSDKNILTLKLLKKNLNWKLVLLPELYLGEEYFKGNLEIKNLNLFLKKLLQAKLESQLFIRLLKD